MSRRDDFLLSPGTVINGKWVILEFPGKGGMAEIVVYVKFRKFDQTCGTPVFLNHTKRRTSGGEPESRRVAGTGSPHAPCRPCATLNVEGGNDLEETGANPHILLIPSGGYAYLGQKGRYRWAGSKR